MAANEAERITAAQRHNPNYTPAFAAVHNQHEQLLHAGTSEGQARNRETVTHNTELLYGQVRVGDAVRTILDTFGVDEERTTYTTNRFTQTAATRHGGETTQHKLPIPGINAKRRSDTAEHVTNFREQFSKPIAVEAADPNDPNNTNVLYVVFRQKIGYEEHAQPLDSIGFEVYEAPVVSNVNMGNKGITLAGLKKLGAKIAIDDEGKPVTGNAEAISALQARDIRDYPELERVAAQYEGVDLSNLGKKQREEVSKQLSRYGKLKRGMHNEHIDPRLEETLITMANIIDNATPILPVTVTDLGHHKALTDTAPYARIVTERNPAIAQGTQPAPYYEPHEAPEDAARAGATWRAYNSEGTTQHPSLTNITPPRPGATPPRFTGETPAAEAPVTSPTIETIERNPASTAQAPPMPGVMPPRYTGPAPTPENDYQRNYAAWLAAQRQQP